MRIFTNSATLLAMITFLALAACASPEQIAAREAAINAADHRECVALGFEPGTEGYGNCRLELKSIRAQKETARAIDRQRLYDPWFYGPYPWRRYPYYW